MGRLQVFNYFFRGEGKSWNAQRAESEGRYPITRAVPIVAEKYGITQKLAKKVLQIIGSYEWHHTGVYGRRTVYYDTNIIKWQLKEAMEKIKTEEETAQ